MSRPTRLLAALGALCVLPASLAVTAQPATAEPVIHLIYANTDGSTHLARPNVDVAIPTFDLESDLDLGTGALTGSGQLPDLTARVDALGLQVIAVTRLVPIGDLTGQLSNDGTLTATTTFNIEIVRMSLVGMPEVNLVKEGCHAVHPTTLQLVNTQPIDLFSIFLGGTYTIPHVAHCGAATALINRTLPGGGNTLTLHLH